MASFLSVLGTLRRRWRRKRPAAKPPSWQQVHSGPLEGLELFLPTDDRPTGWVAKMLRGDYEPVLLEALRRLAKDGKVLYDIGGHVGFVACAWLSFGGRRVEIFEPSPHNARCIDDVLRRNHLESSARVHRLALGESAEEATLISHASDIGLTSMSHLEGYGVPKMWRQRTTTEVSVPVRSLDDWHRELDPEPPDVVKIDVEGAEASVIRGARECLRTVQPVVFCELHGIYQAVQTTSDLSELGYRATPLDAASGMPLVRFDPR